MMLYGYALSLRRPQLAGIFVGVGLGIGFMSKGFVAPMLFLFISIALLIFRHWRSRAYLTTLGIAILCALPWLTVWPYLVYQQSPALFTDWAWTRNIERWFEYAKGGAYSKTLYYLGALPWLAWPAAPLAAWTVWEARKRIWNEPEFQLLLMSFIVMFVVLSGVRDINDQNAMPMLLPITLLATAALSTLRRGAANALDWFGIMTFALLAIALWSGWTGLLLNYGSLIARTVRAMQPNFQMEVNTFSFCVAVVASVLWIVLVWRVGRSVRRSLINWAAGISLLWILAMTLWLPLLDADKSYRHMVVDLKDNLPNRYNCIADVRVGDNQRAMLEYFGNIKLRQNAARVCNLLLVQGDRIAKPIEDEIGWEKLWEGGRQGKQDERFRLYQRVKQ
jgi:4-amino-4-deoxy-L-arabinose transferase-like glycosyltransferase